MARTARKSRRAAAKPWSSADLKQLRKLAGNEPRARIAKALKRTPAAITFKAFQLQVSLRVKRAKPAARKKTRKPRG
jgi:hypothetical protein